MILLTILFEVLVFLIFSFLFFYVPGKVFFAKFKLRLMFHEEIFLSVSLGLMIFTLLAYFFSWVRLFELIYIVIFISVVYLLKKRAFSYPKFKLDTIVILFVLASSILFSLTMVLSGRFGETVHLAGVNSHDGLWHFALINELKQNFPPNVPTFSGVPLQGYHYFSDFIIAQTSNVTGLSPMSLYFRLYPVLIAFLWGSGAYIVVKKWTQNRVTALFSVFLSFFGGSFSYFLVLAGQTGFSMDDAFGMTQPATSLVNPQFSISIVFVLLFLYSLLNYQETRRKCWLIPMALVTGGITMFKVYAGMIILFGMGLFVGLEGIHKRVFPILAFVISLVLFYLTYWMVNSSAGSLIWAPLWAPHKVLIDNLPWYGYEEKQYTYSNLGVIKGLVEIEVYGLTVFIVGSLGTRVIGLALALFIFIKRPRWPSLFASTLLGMTVVSLGIPLFFIQTGKVFEIIQMSWYFLFFCSMFAAVGLGWLFSRKFSGVLKIILIIIFALLTLPSAYEKAVTYLTPGTVWSSGYTKATDQLSTQGAYDDTVLEMPPEYVDSDPGDILRWYRSSDPMIVGAANKQSFLNFPYFDFPGVDVKPRIEFVSALIKLNEQKTPEIVVSDVQKSLTDYEIHYIFSPYKLEIDKKISNVSLIIEEDGAYVYKVNL